MILIGRLVSFNGFWVLIFVYEDSTMCLPMSFLRSSDIAVYVSELSGIGEAVLVYADAVVPSHLFLHLLITVCKSVP